MVIGPDFVYIGVPRTASNTMSKVYLPQFGGIGDNHDHTRNVPAKDRNKFTFAVVRNPYDRILSVYYHNLRHSPDPEVRQMDFPHFMDRLINKWDAAGTCQLKFLSPEIVRIDRVLRYESIAEEVLELPFNLDKLPWPENRLNAADRAPWQEEIIAHPEYVALIESHSYPDFEYFGYPLWR